MTTGKPEGITLDELEKRYGQGFVPFTGLYRKENTQPAWAWRGWDETRDGRRSWPVVATAHAVIDWAMERGDYPPVLVRDTGKWLTISSHGHRYQDAGDPQSQVIRIVLDASGAAWRAGHGGLYYRSTIGYPEWVEEHADEIARKVLQLLKSGTADGLLSYCMADIEHEEPEEIVCAGRRFYIPDLTEIEGDYRPWLRSTPYYPDPDVETPLFGRLMAAVLSNEAEREHALAALSHGFHGRTTKSVPFWRSETQHGKSLVLSLVADLLGDYARTVPARTLFGQYADPQRAAVELGGARLVLIDEGIGNFRSDETFKALTSGRGDLNARKLYQESAIVAATHTIVMAVNPEQDPNYADPAIRARLVPALPNGDPREIAEIAKVLYPGSEAWKREAPGVLYQMLMRARQALADTHAYGTGEDLPQRGRDLLFQGADMAALGSTVTAWLSSGQAEIDTSAAVLPADVYAAYSTWCHKRGIEPEKPVPFGRALARAGAIYTKRTSAGRLWGVRLEIEQ